MQTKHRGNFMLIKDFKHSSFSREDQIQYINDNKDDLNLSLSKLKHIQNLSSKAEISKEYSSTLQTLPNIPKKKGSHVNRRVSSVTNAICMEYSQDHTDYNLEDGIPESVFDERDKILGNSKGMCVYCHQEEGTSIDHLVPSQNNGRCGLNNKLNNVYSCNRCNSGLKKNKSLEEWLGICHKNWPKHWSKIKCNRLKNHVYNQGQYYYCSEEFTIRLEKWKRFIKVFHEDCINHCWQNNIDPPHTYEEQKMLINNMRNNF